MRNLTITLLIAAAGTAILTGGLLSIQEGFTVTVTKNGGGTHKVNLDLVNFWHSITIDDLRDEDPDGYAALAEMEHTPERDAILTEWQRETRRRIFRRRYGYDYDPNRGTR